MSLGDLNRVCTQNSTTNSFNLNAITNQIYTYEKIQEISDWILEKIEEKPKIAIICGSGLNDLVESLEKTKVFPYEQIPDFPRSTVDGHKGNLVFGYFSSTPVICMQGRFHTYEGYSNALVCMPIKLFKILGVKTVILTCAAGGINPSYQVGDLVLIRDHIAPMLWTSQHPLIGINDERFGTRFPPANKIYSKKLRDLFKSLAEEKDVLIKEGVYLYLSGPSYETVSELRFFATMGVDCLGASTAHEALVASYCGLEVLSLALITNKAVMEEDSEESANHVEVVQVANEKAKIMEMLVKNFITRFEI